MADVRVEMPKRVELKPHPKCMYCLGSGESVPLVNVGSGPTVCSCILEQITIVVPLGHIKDYKVIDRHRPARAKYERR